MKIKFLLLPLLICATLSYGQTLSPSVIALAGGHEKTPGGTTISWTIGEPVVDPIRSGDVLLTQGFQQPNLKVSTGFVDPSFAFGLRTYPNPVNSKLILETDYKQQVSFQLVDLTGKLIRAGNWTHKNVMDVSALNQGIYAIYFMAENKMVKSDLIIKQ